METIVRKIKTCESETITMTFIVCKGNQEFYENIENFLFSQPKDKEIMTGRDSKGYQTFEIRTNNDRKEDKEFYINYLVDSNKVKRTSYTESGTRHSGFQVICKSLKVVDKVFNDYLETYKRLEGSKVQEVQEVVEVVEVETQAKEVKIFTKATGEYAYSIWFTNDFNEIYSSKENCRLNKENCKDDFFFHCFKNGQYIKSIDGDCGFACPQREMQEFDTITEHGPDCDMVFLKKYNDSEIEKYLNNNLDDDYCLESDLVIETQVEVETQEVETLTFPTIQNFLENTKTIEECGNGDLVVYTQGKIFLTADKEFCKKYLANDIFKDGDKTKIKKPARINIADKSYDFVELEKEEE